MLQQLEMKYKRLRYSHSLAEAVVSQKKVDDSLVIMLRRPIKRRLKYLSPSSESLAPSSDSFFNPSICYYLALHNRHFVRHLGICNRICVKLLQLMCAVITNISVKKQSSCINKWLSYRQLQCFTAAIFCPPSWNLLSDLCQTSTTNVRCHYAQFSEKNEVSVLING